VIGVLRRRLNRHCCYLTAEREEDTAIGYGWS